MENRKFLKIVEKDEITISIKSIYRNENKIQDAIVQSTTNVKLSILNYLKGLNICE